MDDELTLVHEDDLFIDDEAIVDDMTFNEGALLDDFNRTLREIDERI